MSTMDATFDLPPARSLSAPLAQAGLQPWGFWGSLGWGLFAAATGLFGAVVATAIWMLAHQLHMPELKEAAYANGVGIITLIAPMAVIVFAVKIRKFSLRDYLALNAIPRRELAIGIAGLAVIIVVFGAMELLLGIDAGSKSVEATYREARLAGMLPLLWLITVVVAPVTEELLFRGFLHRGWAPSWLGVAGTIVLTSALWAILHQQYNAIGIVLIFLMGLLFGWVRRRSGSTSLTIVLHALNNLFAFAMVTLQVEWLS